MKLKPDDWSALAPVQPPAPGADGGQGDEIAAPANVSPTDGKEIAWLAASPSSPAPAARRNAALG